MRLATCFWIFGLALFRFFFLTGCLFAQTETTETVTAPSTNQSQTKSDPSKEAPSGKKKERRGAFVVAPIPISSPALGTGVTVAVGYIFPLRKDDKVSPPSIIGGGALFTDNGSRGFAAASELYFAQDRYHVVSGLVGADLHYYFYGTGTDSGNAGIKFGLDQSMKLVVGSATRRMFRDIFVGRRALFGTTSIAPSHAGDTHADLPPLNADLGLSSLGVKFERETVANRFYPTGGSSSQLSADFFARSLGGSYTFQTYRATFNVYQGISQRQVVAYNLNACMTGGQAPYFGQCIFGTNNELRGYPAGRYIDRDMLATQVEYRATLPWRLGAVVFAGIGEVGPRFGDFDYSNLLPSVGVGPRFNLSTKYHVNLRADFAWGKNGHTFSMGLAEAF